MKAYIVLLSALLLIMAICSGCVTLYQRQVNELRQSYEAGLISANDYYARLNELRMMEQQRSQAFYNHMRSQYQIRQQRQRNSYYTPTRRPQIPLTRSPQMAPDGTYVIGTPQWLPTDHT